MKQGKEGRSREEMFRVFQQVYVWAFLIAQKAVRAGDKLRPVIALAAVKNGEVEDAGNVNLLGDEGDEVTHRRVLAAVVEPETVDVAVYITEVADRAQPNGGSADGKHRDVAMTLASRGWIAEVRCGKVLGGELIKLGVLRIEDLKRRE